MEGGANSTALTCVTLEINLILNLDTDSKKHTGTWSVLEL